MRFQLIMRCFQGGKTAKTAVNQFQISSVLRRSKETLALVHWCAVFTHVLDVSEQEIRKIRIMARK